LKGIREMNPVICFIDDSEFEHDLVQYEIAPSAPDLEFVQAYAFDEAKDLLAAKIPSLFLLDLWGQDKDVLRSWTRSMGGWTASREILITSSLRGSLASWIAGENCSRMSVSRSVRIESMAFLISGRCDFITLRLLRCFIPESR